MKPAMSVVVRMRVSALERTLEANGCNWKEAQKRETAMEIDTVGFNLYRSESPDGPYTKLNDTIIPSQVPGAPFGADYA